MRPRRRRRLDVAELIDAAAQGDRGGPCIMLECFPHQPASETVVHVTLGPDGSHSISAESEAE